MSGIAATAIGISRAKDKPWRSDALRDVLVRTALPCVLPASEDRRCLAGIVNIEAILAELRGREETLSLGNHTDDSSRGEDIMLDSETGVDTSHSTPHQPDITPQSTPESCSCGCGGKPTADRCSCTSANHGPQKIFALGTLWFDFETEARQDNMAIFMSKHQGQRREKLSRRRPC